MIDTTDVAEVLAAAERDLAAAAARVTALRRALPPGPVIDLWTPLTTAAGRPTTLDALFGAHDTLLVLHLGDPPAARGSDTAADPCATVRVGPGPGLTALDRHGLDPEDGVRVDGVDPLVPHLAAHAGVVVVSPARPGTLADVARDRGWRHVRVASTQPGDLTAACGAGDADGSARSAITVLARTPFGARVRRRADAGPDGHGLDAFCALWPLLDALPTGRGSWRPTDESRTAPASATG